MQCTNTGPFSSARRPPPREGVDQRVGLLRVLVERRRADGLLPHLAQCVLQRRAGLAVTAAATAGGQGLRQGRAPC